MGFRGRLLINEACLVHFIQLCSAILLFFIFYVQDQITEDLFPGEEEEESSADDLTPSVTSNTSDLLQRLQGKPHEDNITHDFMTFKLI